MKKTNLITITQLTILLIITITIIEDFTFNNQHLTTAVLILAFLYFINFSEQVKQALINSQ